MDEYISKQGVYRAACAGCTCHGDEIGSCFSSEPCEKLVSEFASAYAADVAPVVHAMWIPSESDFDDDDTLFDVEEWCDWQCSACREDICYDDPMPLRVLPKYCPNCGAKMDESMPKDGAD